MRTIKIQNYTQHVTSETDLRTILQDNRVTDVEARVREFRQNGVTKFRDRQLNHLTVRRAS